MTFEFEESEIQFIYTNLRKFPLSFNDVHPILVKIETQFNKNKVDTTNNEAAVKPAE